MPLGGQPGHGIVPGGLDDGGQFLVGGAGPAEAVAGEAIDLAEAVDEDSLIEDVGGGVEEGLHPCAVLVGATGANVGGIGQQRQFAAIIGDHLPERAKFVGAVGEGGWVVAEG